MLNEELLTDKDKKIANLTFTINRFKVYDKKRKHFVGKLQEELEDISEKYTILKDSIGKDQIDVQIALTNKINNLRKTIKQQLKQINGLHLQLDLVKDEDRLQTAKEIAEHSDLLKVAEERNKLRKELQQYKKENKSLIERITQLRVKYEN